MTTATVFLPSCIRLQSSERKCADIPKRNLSTCIHKGSQYSITERRVPELIPVLGSQPAGDVSHKPGGRLPLHPARPALPPQPLRGLLPVSLLGEQRHNGVNSLPKTVTRQRRDCDFNPGPSAPESSTLTTRLPSHRIHTYKFI